MPRRSSRSPTGPTTWRCSTRPPPSSSCRSKSRPAHRQQAVDAARAALRQWTRENEGYLWAKAHYALGNALMSLGDKLTGTDEYTAAIAAFDAALTVFTKADSRTEWLITMKKY